MTVPRNYQKTEESVVPQLLIWSSHSLAYEITQLAKTNIPHSMGCTLLCDGPHPVECASLWIWTNLPLTYCRFSHWIFAMRHQSLSFIRSWSQASWVLARLKSWKWGAEGRKGKAVGKMCRRFIGLILDTKKIKDKRTPTNLGNSH